MFVWWWRCGLLISNNRASALSVGRVYDVVNLIVNFVVIYLLNNFDGFRNVAVAVFLTLPQRLTA